MTRGADELSPREHEAAAMVSDAPQLIHGLKRILHELSVMAEDADEVATEVITTTRLSRRLHCSSSRDKVRAATSRHEGQDP